MTVRFSVNSPASIEGGVSSSIARVTLQREQQRRHGIAIRAGDRDVSTPWLGHGDALAAGVAGATVARSDAAHLSNIERHWAFTPALTGFSKPAAETGDSMRRAILGSLHVDNARRTAPLK